MQCTEQKVRKAYEKLTKCLIDNKLTITTMESCTSGQIASLLTDTEGASAILKGAFITYSNEAKIMQGVPEETIETYGVYSEETAMAMAETCRKKYQADIGIGVTGTMGNVDPENDDSVPGEIYFAIDFMGTMNVYKKELPMQASRYEYKLAVAKEVEETLCRIIQEK